VTARSTSQPTLKKNKQTGSRRIMIITNKSKGKQCTHKKRKTQNVTCKVQMRCKHRNWNKQRHKHKTNRWKKTKTAQFFGRFWFASQARDPPWNCATSTWPTYLQLPVAGGVDEVFNNEWENINREIVFTEQTYICVRPVVGLRLGGPRQD